ncbi:integral membrane protein [Gracilibacillus boraciitolerans JCM 21714]|uniref:Integral membrane protein n=1 Tax=Gracilibacillus boraciitolerans JCM 21714 TaxID=1298598 RepID=W4VL41_9BACI|nr:integral membrane protein [Gracilibacillus boraciitolerans JCM 21714]
MIFKGNGLRRWIGELLRCHWCTGIWTAIFLFIGFYFFSAIFLPIIIILAMAGVAPLSKC